MLKTFKRLEYLKNTYGSRVIFDTRLLRENDIFIGIKSDKKDGSDYYQAAISKKAKLLIINKKIDNENILFVKDTLNFIEKYVKFLIQSYKGKIIAVTGSVGKSTVKENLFHILNNNNYLTYRSFKNFNNLLGLRFSIMNMKLHTKFSIFELGINNKNEMKKLIDILNPHYSLITNIENSHIGNFKNFDELIRNKLQVFNSNRLIKGMINYHYDFKKIPSFILKKSNIVKINIKSIIHNSKKFKKFYKIKFKNNNKSFEINSERDGVYLEIAISSFLFLEMFIKKFKNKNFFYESAILEGRGLIKEGLFNTKKIKVFDHSYNASPYSLKRQILEFHHRKLRRKMFILGSMKELGDLTDSYHLEILNLVKSINLISVIFIGKEFYKFQKIFPNYKFFKDINSFISQSSMLIEYGQNMFVMGSNSNNLQKIIQNVS